MKSGMKVTRDDVAKFRKSLDKLLRKEVLVGVPQANTERDADGGPINNAALGYIHEFGSPSANIPARPFLIPGIRAAQNKTNSLLEKAGRAALLGKDKDVDRFLEAAGMTAQMSVRALINSGIEPALADSTLRARARRGRKGASQELANRTAGQQPSTALAKPLIDTGQLRNSITYVVRDK